MALSNSPRLISLEEAIKEQLKCICCKRFMWPPIRHCIKGHSFCGFCYAACKPTGCNQCGEECRGDRTHHLEKLLEIVTFPCKYAELGCDVSIPFKDLLKHEPTCFVYWNYCLEPWIKSLAKL